MVDGNAGLTRIGRLGLIQEDEGIIRVRDGRFAYNELGKYFLHLFIKNMASWIFNKGGLACPVGETLNGRSCHCAKVA